MATLTQGQLKTYATMVGLPNPSLMAAIAMAESSGRTDVVNSIGCVGPWQINQPVWVKTYPQWTVDYLKKPLNNANAARVVLNAQGLGAWEAYTNGSYKQYMSGGTAQQAGFDWYGTTVPGMIQDAVSGENPFSASIDAASASVKMIGKAGEWVSNPQNWVRVGYVVGGAVLIFIAFQKVIMTSGPGKDLIKAVA